MANTMKTMRISSLLAQTRATKYAAQRSFTSFHRNRAATNFTMPALSPTMTEGNIASWRVKEGDSFSAGDVLLEIETDKATMDVEAQDDGILMKIVVPDESKAIQVGSRIAVVAEAGDDISSLELPPDESPKQASESKNKQQEEKSDDKAPEKSKQSASSDETRSSSKADSQSQGSAEKSESSPLSSSTKQSGKGQNKKYPLYPSVQHLLHENDISGSAIDKIQATGPGGRLLKGDVLAYLGHIDKKYPAEASARLEKLSHLDLSNIQLAEAKPKAAEPKTETKQPAPQQPKEIDFALPISLTAVVETQKRVENLLKTSIPLSVFIARASELANEDLPLPKQRTITSDELFNAVLGLPAALKTTSRGRFVPQLSTINLAAASKSKPRTQPDIIDILSGTKSSPRRSPPARRATSATGLTDDLFSVTARPGEEQRAMVYLERLKSVLENDPGRLVV